MERKKEKKKKKKKKKRKTKRVNRKRNTKGLHRKRNAGERVPVSRRGGEALVSADLPDREFEASIPPLPRPPTARECNK